MPIIPKRESTQSILTSSPIARRSPQSDSLGSRIQQQIGQTIEDVSAQFKEAQSLSEVTNADIEASKRIKEVQLEAQSDPDVWDIEKYQNKINDIKQEASKGITLATARSSFSTKFEMDAVNASFNIRSSMRKRQIDSMRGDMITGLDSMKDQFVNAQTDVEQKRLKDKRDLLLQQHAENGVISREAAAKLKIKTSKEWSDTEVRTAISSDAEIAKEMLLAGDFEDLSADETASWLEIADKKIKRNEQVAAKEQQTTWLKNGGEVIANLEGTSAEDLIQMVANGSIDPKLGNDLIEWKTDPTSVQYETDKSIWMEIAKNSVTPNADLRAFQDSLSKAIANNQIQATEAAELSVQVQGLYDKAIKFQAKPDLFNMLKKRAIDSFENLANGIPGSTVNIAYEMTKELFTRVRDGVATLGNIEEQTLEIMEDTKKITNQNRAQYKIGDVVNTPAGPRIVDSFDADGEPLMRVK